jgi:hypothetical protein
MGMPVDRDKNLNAKDYRQDQDRRALPGIRPIEPAKPFKPWVVYNIEFPNC